MKPKLLLWDSDGCLVDSLSISMQNFVDAVQPYLSKKKIPSYHEIFDNYLGANEENDVLKLAEIKGIPKKLFPEIQKRFINVKQTNLLKIPLFKGIDKVISHSHDLGFKQALVTGRDKSSAYKIWSNPYNVINNKKVSDYFDYILAGDDYPGKSKAFELVAKKYGLKGKNILVLGDEAKDISTGNQLRFRTGATLWGTFEKDKLLNQKPNEIFKTPRDLLNYLKG